MRFRSKYLSVSTFIMPSIPIRRVSHTTDETAPWDGVVFIYDVGSDELAEALRACFPEFRTLRERKHAAIIRFLEKELKEMPLSKSLPCSAKVPSTQDLPHVDVVCGDVPVNAQGRVQLQNILSTARTSTTSNCTSTPKETFKRCTAPSTPATQPSYIDPTAATHSSQFVFNAIDGRTMQQKTKRRMTVEERIEYKETRKRGACPDCKQKKGKCTHMNGVGTSTGSHSDMADQSKRMFPLGPHTPDTKFSKPRTLQQTLDRERHDSVVSQLCDSEKQQLSDASCRSSSVSRQSPLGSTSPRWAHTVNEEPQSGMPGYVQQSHLSEQVPSFTTEDQGWIDYYPDNQDSFESFDYFQSGSTFQCTQDSPGHRGCPDIRIHKPDQGVYEPLDNPFSNHWDLGQQPRPDDTSFP